MKTTELRQKNTKELQEILNKTKKDLSQLFVDLNERKEKDLRKPLKSRRLIARVLTILKEKEILKTAEGDKNNV